MFALVAKCEHKALSGCQSDSFRTCDVSEAFRHVRVPRVYARGVYVTRLLRRMARIPCITRFLDT